MPLCCGDYQEKVMRDFEYDYETLLNGAAVTVVLDVTTHWGDEDPTISLKGVYYEGVDIVPVLDVNTVTALEMEAESVLKDTGNE